jgi:hypothetical protein
MSFFVLVILEGDLVVDGVSSHGTGWSVASDTSSVERRSEFTTEIPIEPCNVWAIFNYNGAFDRRTMSLRPLSKVDTISINCAL